MSKQEILIFGGTFNPFHLGHYNIIEVLRNKYPNALIIVVPCDNRFKPKSIIPIKKRIELTKKALENQSSVIVEDWTLHWDTSATINLVKKVEDLYPKASKIKIVIGDDLINSIQMWKSFDELLKYQWVIIKREGKSVNLQVPLQFEFISCPTLTISSTAIRTQPGLIDQYVPSSIREEVKRLMSK